MLFFLFAMLLFCPKVFAANGHDAVTASFQFNSLTGEIRIPVWINGEGPFTMKLDTGATISVISPQAAEQGMIRITGNSTDLGASGAHVSMALGKIAELKVGHFVLQNAPCIIGDPNEGQGCEGILAGPLFSEYAVALDFREEKIGFYDGALYTPPANSVCVPMQFDRNHLPVCQAVVGGEPLTLEVDTGFAGQIELLPDTVEHYGLAQKYREIAVVTVRSVDSTRSSGVYEMGEVSLAGDPRPVSWPAVHAIFDSSFGPLAARYDYDGRIGAGLLSKYTVTFDYVHSRLVFAR